MEIIQGTKGIINGQPVDISVIKPEISTEVFYEVIRVIKGKFLFLADHLSRLRRSCSVSISDIPSELSVSKQLHQLITINNIEEGNIKIDLYRSVDQTSLACYFIPFSYPTSTQYREGVKVGSYKFERPDPTVKRWNEGFRKRVNEFIQDNSIYEALLESEEGVLTEGSRSNLFFIDHQDHIFTASEEQVLPGITRKYILQLCEEQGFKVIEQALSKAEATHMTGCFLSGTSPKILPVSQLDDLCFRPDHPVTKRLMVVFDRLVNDSIS